MSLVLAAFCTNRLASTCLRCSGDMVDVRFDAVFAAAAASSCCLMKPHKHAAQVRRRTGLFSVCLFFARRTRNNNAPFQLHGTDCSLRFRLLLSETLGPSPLHLDFSAKVAGQKPDSRVSVINCPAHRTATPSRRRDVLGKLARGLCLLRLVPCVQSGHQHRGFTDRSKQDGSLANHETGRQGRQRLGHVTLTLTHPPATVRAPLLRVCITSLDGVSRRDTSASDTDPPAVAHGPLPLPSTPAQAFIFVDSVSTSTQASMLELRSRLVDAPGPSPGKPSTSDAVVPWPSSSCRAALASRWA